MHNSRLSSVARKFACRMAGGLFLSVIASVAFVMVFAYCSRQPFVAPDTSSWETGDIFFSAGNSWRSAVVRLFGGKSEDMSTHCGFVLMVDGEPMLVHMSTEKNVITMESVEEYARINDVRSITARRLQNVPDTLALRRDLLQLIEARKPFDNSFDHNDTSAYYCTELVVRELERLGQPIFSRLLSNDYIYPADLEKSL